MGDYVIVKYELQEKRGTVQKWIRKILRVNENNTFLVTFLRSRRTQLHSSFIYSYPDKPHEDTVYKTQIWSKIPAPPNFSVA